MENFDAMAKNYDTDKRINRAKIIANKIRLHVSSEHKRSAMEYGCGTGLVGLQLVNDFKSLLLIDSSIEMINQVEQKIYEVNNATISTLCCDLMEDIPKNLQTDYIFSSLVLHYIKDTEEALRRFYDLLSDGGHLLIVDIDEEDGSFHAKYPDFDGHNGFNHSVLTNLALKAGFATVTIETFFHDTKIFECKENPYSLFILDAMK